MYWGICYVYLGIITHAHTAVMYWESSKDTHSIDVLKNASMYNLYTIQASPSLSFLCFNYYTVWYLTVIHYLSILCSLLHYNTHTLGYMYKFIVIIYEHVHVHVQYLQLVNFLQESDFDLSHCNRICNVRVFPYTCLKYSNYNTSLFTEKTEISI